MQRFRKEIFQFKQHIFAIGIEIQSQCCVVVSSRGFHFEFLAFDVQCSTRAFEGRKKIIFVSSPLSTVLLFSRFYMGSP